jgi:hypothetical protein
MKFRITATSGDLGYAFGEHTIYMTRNYGFLKDKVNFEQTKSPVLPETTIDIKDLDELIQLVNSLNGREIIIYKDYYYDDMNNKVYDDKYTIEIYDDYRE